MKYSKLFGKTTYGEQKGSEMISHQFLTRGGFIKESVAGRYFFLPLGWRVHEKIKAIIKDEMDKAGAQEMISPVLHPLELWQETNRTNTTGFELMKVTDRRGGEFALGGTAEEMFVDVVRKFQVSYKDLPFNIYQFSTKFRDELRARGGLLRVREFVMKDAYSFSRDEEEFKIEYQKMWQTYTDIFERLGLQTMVVESDNGYIGGEYCHEFQVEHPDGEGKFFVSEDGSYVAHEEVAIMKKVSMNESEEEKPVEEVDAPRGNTIEDGVKLHGLPAWQQMKSVMYIDEQGRYILAVIRGDWGVNEMKLRHQSGSIELRPATEEEIVVLGSTAGFISPVNLKNEKLLIVADDSLVDIKNMYTGANAVNRDLLNVNYGRDWQAGVVGDIAQAVVGAEGVRGGKLAEKQGIEVGNIFQLGYHYTKLMKDAVYTDVDGQTKPYYMGCYGIGLGRTMATIVEKFHDDKGIVWPKSVAPYQVHLISLSSKDPAVVEKNNAAAQSLHDELEAAGVEVLWDDRAEFSAGAKFADADLIGIPLRLVISEKTLKENSVEWKERSAENSQLVLLSEIVTSIKKFLE
ncbi:MAG: Proline-tRNA ligase [Candidatus Uhrbacteria bacterium GW2011_GWE2_45_35]|uniref:Proline--tRNA ligase n=2 Tax=Candidatus Uhriibacteriota TaxID=1752732 RepID=A0A0G1JEX2_9BACT|nr:MAG: Proline-tRNA ligase [Candidatus Uhrbacteria bacterium GW2011_GWF2_44_350]KKU06563.1 MAG: Proline-tRNA ligase [Candidatus Uhrbacteria bacterium GW2011_GWE2_45_35]HBR80089.1 proline--tRNA ligase [Candidatus Uhrbacteria bacterium]HCU32211.1 proline--tRNA ligase [Candidatus Uhrbacteria bacterium]